MGRAEDEKRCGCSGHQLLGRKRFSTCEAWQLLWTTEFGRRSPQARQLSGLPNALKQSRQTDRLAVMNHRFQNHCFQAEIGPIQQHDRNAGQRLVALHRSQDSISSAPGQVCVDNRRVGRRAAHLFDAFHAAYGRFNLETVSREESVLKSQHEFVNVRDE